MFARAAHPGGDPAGGREQDRSGPARHVERDDRSGRAVGGREPVGEAPDDLDLGTTERVDGLVRVADDDQVAAAAGEQGEQLFLCRVGVLVLVDDDEDAGVALACEQPGVVAQQVDRRPDQLGGVVRRWLPQTP